MRDKKVSRILVTGGAGFIGSHIAEALLRRGHTVTVLDDLSGGFKDNIAEGCCFVEGNICNEALVNQLFEQNHFEYVYHLAAYAAEGLSHFIKRFNYTNNLIGSINLINASINHEVKCFVFTSSIAVYGVSPELPMTEQTIPSPEDPYGIAKLAIEQELKVSKKMFGLNHIIFRPHNVYGERQNIGDRYRNVVGIFMNQVLQGKPMSIFGDGTQTRAFSYIGDIVPTMVQSIETPAAYNEIFNIGADQPFSVKDLALATARAMEVEQNTQHLPPRNEVMEAYSSHDKVERIFGPQPKTSLEDGLKRMAGWVTQHGARSSQKFKNIEVTKNFPTAWIS